jgi:hypothetical protein
LWPSGGGGQRVYLESGRRRTVRRGEGRGGRILWTSPCGLLSAITIPVDPDTAQSFEQPSAEERCKLILLLSLRLRELTAAELTEVLR